MADKRIKLTTTERLAIIGLEEVRDELTAMPGGVYSEFRIMRAAAGDPAIEVYALPEKYSCEAIGQRRADAILDALQAGFRGHGLSLWVEHRAYDEDGLLFVYGQEPVEA